ncbi:DUF6537 domain-containing protein [Rhodopseudomonas sp. B29]|uniref:DUF6537 domain-containing protein n=1 Tax=Rhodopseudomonas sp. B29 TaxID=95607 RepID=UPI000344B751|nr:DUF6537 domain-containing protein [Rhodopseudomonas sp. B29]
MAAYLDALRSTLAELLGQNELETPVVLPQQLPAALRGDVEQAVAILITYQNPGYAQLYLERLGRFAGRRDVSEVLLSEIARLLLDRMAYEDPIRIAQLTLDEAAIGPDGVPARRVDKKCRFRIDEMVAALPEVVADPVLDTLGRVGLLHMPMKIRFNATDWLGVRRLRIEASLRRWRLLSVRYAVERVWVERWLHMIDRALSQRPDSVMAIVHSATMVRGYGDHYRYGMANWSLIIDTLIKPALCGDLQLPDLPAAIAEARAAALPERKQITLRRVISAIRVRAGASPLPPAKRARRRNRARLEVDTKLPPA